MSEETSPDLQNYEQLRQAVADAGGVLTVEMGTLRTIHGAGKLGAIVRENITRELRSRGMNHPAGDLPAYQHEKVRIWLAGTPAGDLIEAVYNPSLSADQVIRDAVSVDAAEVLRRVRELVAP